MYADKEKGSWQGGSQDSRSRSPPPANSKRSGGERSEPQTSARDDRNRTAATEDTERGAERGAARRSEPDQGYSRGERERRPERHSDRDRRARDRDYDYYGEDQGYSRGDRDRRGDQRYERDRRSDYRGDGDRRRDRYYDEDYYDGYQRGDRDKRKTDYDRYAQLDIRPDRYRDRDQRQERGYGDRDRRQDDRYGRDRDYDYQGRDNDRGYGRKRDYDDGDRGGGQRYRSPTDRENKRAPDKDGAAQDANSKDSGAAGAEDGQPKDGQEGNDRQSVENSEPPPMTTIPKVGAWCYDQFQYLISKDPDDEEGFVFAEELSAELTIKATLKGEVKQGVEWWGGQLIRSDDGKLFGTIRLRFDQEGTTVSNIRKPTDRRWDADIIAHPVEEPKPAAEGAAAYDPEAGGTPADLTTAESTRDQPAAEAVSADGALTASESKKDETPASAGAEVSGTAPGAESSSEEEQAKDAAPKPAAKGPVVKTSAAEMMRRFLEEAEGGGDGEKVKEQEPAPKKPKKQKQEWVEKDKKQQKGPLPPKRRVHDWGGSTVGEKASSGTPQTTAAKAAAAAATLFGASGAAILPPVRPVNPLTGLRLGEYGDKLKEGASDGKVADADFKSGIVFPKSFLPKAPVFSSDGNDDLPQVGAAGMLEDDTMGAGDSESSKAAMSGVSSHLKNLTSGGVWSKASGPPPTGQTPLSNPVEWQKKFTSNAGNSAPEGQASETNCLVAQVVKTLKPAQVDSCDGCGATAGTGAIDGEDGKWYCTACWVLTQKPCGTCFASTDLGAIDTSDGLWYCKVCWAVERDSVNGGSLPSAGKDSEPSDQSADGSSTPKATPRIVSARHSDLDKGPKHGNNSSASQHGLDSGRGVPLPKGGAPAAGIPLPKGGVPLPKGGMRVLQ